MDAFATYQDLEKLLNRTFATAERAWVTELLESASAYLRGVIGQQVYPQSTSSFTGYPVAGSVDLPQLPVVEIVSVQRDGEDVEFKFFDTFITFDGEEPVKVTFTYGLSVAPQLLKNFACVLASQVMTTAEMQLGLTAGGLSSVSIDDFRVSFADGGEGTGMQLTDRNVTLLRERYGSQVSVGGMRR